MRGFVSVLSIAITMLCACKKTTNSTNQSISYGTSFGMCVGYCQNTMTITGNKATLIRLNPRTKDKKVCEILLSAMEIEAIRNELAKVEFEHLDTIYGCPDCADGGAAFIEMDNGSKRKKVIFPYGGAPAPLMALSKQLQAALASFKDCE